MRPPRIFLAPAGALALILACPAAAFAQPKEDWEGKIVEDIVKGRNWNRQNFVSAKNKLAIKKDQPITREKLDQSYKDLWATLQFKDVQIVPAVNPATGKVVVTIHVVEYEAVDAVEFKGLKAIPLNQIKPTLRIGPGSVLNDYHLKQDRDYIREQYLLKGYYFSSVREEYRRGPTGVILTWVITEGPMVSVREIIFSGNRSVSDGDLRRYMLTRPNGRLLFIPTGKEPFVERNLREDIERIKLYYRLEGWLDIHFGERVFVKDLVFNEDRTQVTIKIHVDEGDRYRIRSVRFQHDAGDKILFPDEEIRPWLVSKEGDYYTENNANRDVQSLRSRYGEKAYILAEISHTYIADREKNELDLVFTIKENQKQFVGRIVFEGNTKTREDVLRREMTRRNFVPGEEFNNRNLTRALTVLRDKGWMDPMKNDEGYIRGIRVRTAPGDQDNSQDVNVDLREGDTGNIRFAAGYSSAFGILGIFEFQQRNFDLGDLPSSFSDLLSGNGFAGGGQNLRIRLAPAARRQSYVAEFREPYVFGYEFGLGLRGYSTNTIRESWDEERVGGSITFDKRFEPFAAQLTLNGYEIDIDDVEANAPLSVQELSGNHTVFSLTPAVIFDTRDSILIPSEGVRISLSYEYGGQILGGDFDFHKYILDFEGYLTVWDLEPLRPGSMMKHVLSTQLTFGWAEEARDRGPKEVPIFERFFAGGRDSIRGFDFRGMGPHQNGDPVGGEAYVFASVEYSFPLFVEILRGAFFYDLANLTPTIDDLSHQKWRNTVGFGIRFMIPQLGNIPVALDFGFPLSKDDDDERQTVTFDIGKLF